MKDGELEFGEAAEAGDRSRTVTTTTVTGEIVSKIFTSEDGHFAIVRICDADDRNHVLLGPLGALCEGQDISATGVWEFHSNFGKRLRVSEFREILPTTEEGICRYLASGIIPGVGPKLAERIVAKFGRETLAILDRYSSRLTEVPGLGRKKLDSIRSAWTTRSKRRDSYVFLQGLGITTAYCNRLFKRYGDETPEIVSENPYRLANDVKGIGFRMADAIAGKLQIARDNPYRLGSGIVYVLKQLTEQGGHTCYPEPALLEKAAGILDVSVEVAVVGIERAIADGAVIRESRDGQPDPLVYSAPLHAAESRLADFLRSRIDRRATIKVDQKVLANLNFPSLNHDQKQAVVRAFQNPLSIVTGGPGVGKTTATREIVAAAEKLNLRLALAAPTGRAAKRLSESSGHHAQTIHRLLKWDPERQHFSYSETNCLNIDILVIDEVSMLDVVLAFSVLSALPDSANLVLIGDKDQLPSIGPGNLLQNLIESEYFPVSHLTQIYRQGRNSRIISNAHRVNQGDLPDLQRHGEELTDFYWIEQPEPPAVVDVIKRMVSDRIPGRFKLSPLRDIQVLTPMNRGVCGTVNLNRELQQVVNPESSGPVLRHGETEFRLRDRVMQISNNYDLNVFNGDLGSVHFIDIKSGTFQVRFDTGVVTYDVEEADQLRLAYAATIHKSQGSEFPAVIVPLIMSHAVMLRRSLIYTAMTRASRLLVMVGATKAVALAVSNFRMSPRYSALINRLAEDDQS